MQPSNIVGSDLLRVRLSTESRQLFQINDLSEACSRGESSEVIKQIITELTANDNKYGMLISPFSRTDSFGRTALHYASMKGRTSVIELLLENGFSPNFDDMHGSYPLHLAIQTKQYDAAIKLCKESKPNLTNYRREHAITLLCKNSFHPKMITLLSELVKNGNAINMTDQRNCNASFHAADKPRLLKHLIGYGIDVNHRDNFGRNPLFNAVYAGDAESAKLLIEEGCEVELRDDFHHTPLMLAACFGDVKVVDVLIKNGANIDAIMQAKEYIMSPLSFAIRHVNYDVAEFLVYNGASMDISGDEEVIWDLFTEQKYNDCADHEIDDSNNRRNSSGRNESATDAAQLDMAMEQYTMGETAAKNNTSSRHSFMGLEIEMRRVRKQKLFEYMLKVDTERKMCSLMQVQVIQWLGVPESILKLIASPMEWF